MTIARLVCTAVITLALLAPSAAQAQDRKFHFNIGGGPTFPLGELSDRFELGWGPAFGVSYDITDRLGFQFEYAYRFFNLDEDYQVGLISADHTTHQLDFNVMANFTPPDAGVHLYAVAGPGMYHRNVAITRYQGLSTICDPYLYICGTYPVESILGERGGWDFGVNFGGGVGFRFEGVEFYIETRYHYVWGPEVATQGALPANAPANRSANSSYWPLTFGFRF